jgi:hypothetical protein
MIENRDNDFHKIFESLSEKIVKILKNSGYTYSNTTETNKKIVQVKRGKHIVLELKYIGNKKYKIKILFGIDNYKEEPEIDTSEKSIKNEIELKIGIKDNFYIKSVDEITKNEISNEKEILDLIIDDFYTENKIMTYPLNIRGISFFDKDIVEESKNLSKEIYVSNKYNPSLIYGDFSKVLDIDLEFKQNQLWVFSYTDISNNNKLLENCKNKNKIKFFIYDKIWKPFLRR